MPADTLTETIEEEDYEDGSGALSANQNGTSEQLATKSGSDAI